MAVEAKLHLCGSNALALITPSVSPTPVSALPASNLLDSKRGKVCRVTTTPSSVTITGSSAVQYTANCLGLNGHNLDDDCQIRWRLFSGVSQGGATEYDSGTIDVNYIRPWGEYLPSVDPWGDYYAIGPVKLTSTVFDAVQFKSYQIDITNPNANDVDLGFLFGGWAASFLMSWGSSITHVDGSIHQRTAGGGLRTLNGNKYRRIEFSLDWLQTVQDRERLSDILETAGKGGDCFLSLDPTLTTQTRIENTMICRRMIDNKQTRVNAARNSSSFVFEEI